jgi:ABC-2 type transport system permease protein
VLFLDTKNQKFSFVVTDESGLINKQIIQQLGASESTDKQANIDKVTAGSLDAYFYYPKAVGKEKVEVYAKDVGLFDNSRYEAVAKAILQQSVGSTIDAQATAILQDRVTFNSTTYRDGKPFDGFKELIAPGVFLVIF